MKIILIFSLFSLVFVQTFLPLQLYGQSVVPPGMDASQIQDWKRTNSVNVSPTPQSASSGVVAPTSSVSSGFEMGMGVGTTYSDTSGAPQVAVFSNTTNTWVSFLLNLVVMFSIKTMLGIVLINCGVKSLIFAPSLWGWATVTLVWFAATIAFMVTFLMVSKKMAEQFVYDPAKDKDVQIKALKVMIDNAAQLKKLMLIQLIVFASLTAGLEGVVALTAVGCLHWVRAKSAEKGATALALAAIADFVASMTAWEVVKTAGATTIAPCPSVALPYGGFVATAANVTMANGTIVKATTPDALPPLPPMADNLYTLKADMAQIVINQASTKTALDALHIVELAVPSLVTSIGAIATGALTPPPCVGAAGWSGTAEAAIGKVGESASKLKAALVALLKSREALVTSRNLTMLDCGGKMGVLSTIACTAGAFVVDGKDSQSQGCPFLQKSFLTFDFWSDLLFSKAYAIDQSTLLMGIFGTVAYGVSVAVQLVACYLYKTNAMPVGPRNIFINPCFRATFLQIIVLVAAGMDYFMYRSYSAVGDRLTELENLLKQIETLSGTTSTQTAPIATSSPTLSPTPSVLPSETSSEPLPSTTSSSSGSFIPKFSSHDSQTGGVPTEFFSSLTPDKLNSLNLETLNGKGCVAKSSDGFGVPDKDCSCIQKGNCQNFPSDDRSKLGEISPNLKNDYDALQTGLRSIGHSLAKGDLAGATKAALKAKMQDSAKRLVAYKNSAIKQYNQAAATDKNLPPIDLTLTKEELNKNLSGIKQAAGNNLSNSDFNLGTSPVSDMVAGGAENIGDFNKDMSSNAKEQEGPFNFASSHSNSSFGADSSLPASDDPFKDMLEGQDQLDQKYNQEQSQKGALSPKLQTEDPSVIKRPNDSLFHYLSRGYLKAKEKLGLQ